MGCGARWAGVVSWRASGWRRLPLLRPGRQLAPARFARQGWAGPAARAVRGFLGRADEATRGSGDGGKRGRGVGCRAAGGSWRVGRLGCPGRRRGGPGCQRAGPGDRGARPGGPERGQARPAFPGVVRVRGQLRGRRVLPGPPRSWAGVRGQRAERRLGPGDRGARPGGPAEGRAGLGPFGVVRCCGQLRGRRVLRRPRRSPAGVRGRREERRLGPGDRGARPGGAEHGRGAEVSSVSCAAAGSCAAGGFYGMPTIMGRGSWPSRGTASGARRSRCPAWRP